MKKQLTSDQILEIAGRIRKFGIMPGVLLRDREPARTRARCSRTRWASCAASSGSTRDAEIVVQHYIPTPHPDGMYGEIDARFAFPKTPDEWASPRWYNFTVRKDPALPWLPARRRSA